MKRNEKKLKKEHDRYLAIISHGAFDGNKLRSMYPKDELILHVLLESELFYYYNIEEEQRALGYVREAYPDTSKEDMRRVGKENAEIVTAVYG